MLVTRRVLPFPSLSVYMYPFFRDILAIVKTDNSWSAEWGVGRHGGWGWGSEHERPSGRPECGAGLGCLGAAATARHLPHHDGTLLVHSVHGWRTSGAVGVFRGCTCTCATRAAPVLGVAGVHLSYRLVRSGRLRRLGQSDAGKDGDPPARLVQSRLLPKRPSNDAHMYSNYGSGSQTHSLACSPRPSYCSIEPPLGIA